MKKKILHRIVGNQQIHPAVPVDVHGRHRQRLARGLCGGRIVDLNTAGRGNIAEAAVPVVAIKITVAALVGSRWPIGAANPGELVIDVQVDLLGPADIVGDEQIEIAVIVEVQKARAGAPGHRFPANPGICGGVLELPALIAKQAVLAIGRDKYIRIAVIVVITHGNTHTVQGHCQASRFGGVGKPARPVILIELHGGPGHIRLDMARPMVGVDQQHVLVGVIVVIQKSHPAAHGFRQQFVAVGAGEV